MVRPSVLHDRLYSGIKASQTAGFTPIRHRQGVPLLKVVWMVLGVVGLKAVPACTPDACGTFNLKGAKTVRHIVNVVNVFAPNHLANKSFNAVDGSLA